MIWDPCLTRAVAVELTERLQGARARAVSLRRDAMEVVVNFRDATMVADLTPRRGVVVLRPPAEPGEDAEPLPAVLAGIEAVRDERVMVLRFRRVRGRKPHPSLILELATNRWNAILADGPELRVRKRLRVLKARPLRVGLPWIPPGEVPPATARDEVDAAGWAGLVDGRGEAAARSALLQGVAYTSGLNVRHLLRAPTPDDGFRRWKQMADMAALAPHLLRPASGLQPYPWPLRDTPAEPVESLLDAMAAVLADADDADGAGGGRVEVVLATRSRRLERKLRQLHIQLQRTESAGRLREDGGLILSFLHLIETGAEKVILPGFDGQPRMIKLDPQRKPQEYANALFRRATRLERGAAALPGRIRATEEELAGVAELRHRHRRGELSDQEVDVIRSAQPPDPGPRPGAGAPAVPYKSYRSSGGLEIRVGRGARHNDDLTFHHSRPADVWLHARHAAGAHVILRWPHPERPPAADLEEAAVLAANHSGARASGTVPVDWTRRKWVRKPRGAPRGAVVPERVQTVFVSPDPSLGERLGG